MEKRQMKIRKSLFFVLIISLLLPSCGQKAPEELPTPQSQVTTVPDVDGLAQSFLSAWQAKNYKSMYEMLSSSAKKSFSLEDFTAYYEETASNATLQSVDTEVLSTTLNPESAIAKFKVTYNTSLFGSFDREMDMPFSWENDSWLVNWNSGLIMPELGGGSHLSLEVLANDRGAIYDRNGEPIADETTAWSLAIIPNQIEEGKEGQLLNILSELTGKTPESIQASYEDLRLTDWYVAVGEASDTDVQANWDTLVSLGGLQMSKYQTRYYYDGGIAPQAIGYVLSIPTDEVEAYKEKGYQGDEYVGQAGLEKYAEEALAGKPAANLYVVDSNNQVISKLNQADSRLAENITTTLDKNLQIQAQNAIMGFKGAVVVMEVDTGRILAMASSPSLDTNLFDPNNTNSSALLNDLLNDGDQRLLNRVTQGTYPAGSVFKIIDMAAALESDLYTPDTTYYCGSYFEELQGEKFKDWTVDHDLPASGTLTLTQGLIRSCNPWFYHIGLDLFRQKGATYISDMARGFGLGSATGIDQVAEDTGQIVDPSTDGDAVQQGIGQGDMLVTPLQVVRYTAAIANGGTLYRPQLVERITTTAGVDVSTLSPEATGTLPISQETLEAIQTAMRGVVSSRIGTARDALSGLAIPTYGKTGTAQNPMGDSHAWFTGYTDENREDLPDIAVTVIAENAGEGSEIAAPIFRRMIETYFYGEPKKLFDWEVKLNVTKTPTEEFTLTPTEGGEQQSTPAPAG
ncbi:penicillin-binding protein 2 [Pelolinea submarina]|uniref:Penicillin-binding protein 2 n=3 Tax=Pelolinea submarina TaxID=913107 RepID=A0A347ZPV6_9CHLR|nr:penicillin-binding protein 2 [Pelolinea submarina]BBB47337.1 penicillin-binding protein 2 [Pelolinea submarina]